MSESEVMGIVIVYAWVTHRCRDTGWVLKEGRNSRQRRTFAIWRITCVPLYVCVCVCA